MKILWAECCAELVVPHREKQRPRQCKCGNASVWWNNPYTGDLGVFSRKGPKCVSVLGINNSFISAQYPYSKIDEGEEFGCIQKEQIDAIIDATPDWYLFRKQRSNIIKFRPNFPGIVGLTFTDKEAEVPHYE